MPDVEVTYADDGERVTLHRRDLPAVANRRGFEITLPTSDVEEIYQTLRSRQLGADSRGDL